ncbi:MAG: hypothetical protein AAF716_14620 [Cyanobacteria bacterium P01_D01_bin.1]
MQNKFQSPSSSDQNRSTLGKSIQTLWKATLGFMVHRPQPSTPSPTTKPQDRYSAKANLYAYLPDSEEQRDWLERSYKGQ